MAFCCWGRGGPRGRRRGGGRLRVAPKVGDVAALLFASDSRADKQVEGSLRDLARFPSKSIRVAEHDLNALTSVRRDWPVCGHGLPEAALASSEDV